MLTDLDYDLLSAYIDDALSDSERTALELRLQSEPELRSELDELRATVTLLNNLPTLKAPRDLTLDARYARRSSTLFFTSAAFTALSSAAAVILFALGAYLFAGRSASQAPVASNGQEAQLAFRATSTRATTLDKAAPSTPTEETLQNEITITETSSNVFGGIASNDGFANSTSTVLPSNSAAQPPAQPPLIEASTLQVPDTLTINPTLMPTAGFLTGEQPTEDATETAFFEQQTSPSSAAGAVGAAAPSPFDQVDSSGGEANASSALAATEPPMTATTLPTATVLPTETASPTLTLTPSATPTDTDTPAPTDSRQIAQRPPASAPDFLPLIVVALGLVFLLIAVITTIIRRRNRP